jgi:hypothetical protein
MLQMSSPAANQRTVEPSEAASPSAPVLLSDQQLQALRACSRGISLRFDSWEIVNALLLGKV